MKNFLHIFMWAFAFCFGAVYGMTLLSYLCYSFIEMDWVDWLLKTKFQREVFILLLMFSVFPAIAMSISVNKKIREEDQDEH